MNDYTTSLADQRHPKLTAYLASIPKRLLIGGEDVDTAVAAARKPLQNCN